MTNLRMKRLLLLAKHGGDHKRWYSQYCKLRGLGYTQWALGMAFITDVGENKLKELQERKDIF